MKTRAERHKLYKKILAHVRKHGWGHLGFCGQISDQTGEYSVYHSLKELYPEINEVKPSERDGSTHHWFETFGGQDTVREKILVRIIKKTKPKTSYKKTKTKAVNKKTKSKK